MEETRKVLATCPADCDSACHECLMHYWNQRVHAKLDRFAALELLDWCKKSKLPDALSYEKQDELLIPLNHLGSDYIIESDGVKHYIKYENKKREIIVYPSMWNENSNLIPDNTVSISDKLLQYALPKAASVIRSQI